MRQSGLLLDDNRDVSEACVMRPLVEIGSGDDENVKKCEKFTERQKDDGQQVIKKAHLSLKLRLAKKKYHDFSFYEF